MRTAKIVIDGEPRGKGRPRFAILHGRVRVYTDLKTRKYEKQVRNAFTEEPFTGALFVAIRAYLKPPKRCKIPWPTKKPDIDNIAKIILDGLNGKAWADDKQVVKLSILKYWDDYPRVEVTIKELVE